MKRSKAIELIQSTYNKTSYQDYEMGSQDADDILTALEKAGMLPPTICYDSVGEYCKIKDTDILHDNDISFRWEPEDETE